MNVAYRWRGIAGIKQMSSIQPRKGSEQRQSESQRALQMQICSLPSAWMHTRITKLGLSVLTFSATAAIETNPLQGINKIWQQNSVQNRPKRNTQFCELSLRKIGRIINLYSEHLIVNFLLFQSAANTVPHYNKYVLYCLQAHQEYKPGAHQECTQREAGL